MRRPHAGPSSPQHSIVSVSRAVHAPCTCWIKGSLRARRSRRNFSRRLRGIFWFRLLVIYESHLFGDEGDRLATALLTSADALLSDSLEMAVPWGSQDTYSKALGTVFVAAHLHNLLIEQHVEARELAAYVRLPTPLNVASAVVASSPLRESEAKRARSLEPRPVYVGSYLASVPEGAPCVLGLEPVQNQRWRGCGALCSVAHISASTLARSAHHSCLLMLECAIRAGWTGRIVSRRHAGNAIYVVWA